MSIEEYMVRLKAMRDDIPNEIDRILKKNEGLITGMLKLRLYNQGTDGNYDLIGYYSPKTIVHKKAEGKKYSFITLRDSGDFYAGMYLESENGNYRIDSRDSVTPELIDKYGESILELTPKQQIDVINNIINPELQKFIDDNIVDFEIHF